MNRSTENVSIKRHLDQSRYIEERKEHTRDLELTLHTPRRCGANALAIYGINYNGMPVLRIISLPTWFLNSGVEVGVK